MSVLRRKIWGIWSLWMPALNLRGQYFLLPCAKIGRGVIMGKINFLGNKKSEIMIPYYLISVVVPF